MLLQPLSGSQFRVTQAFAHMPPPVCLMRKCCCGARQDQFFEVCHGTPTIVMIPARGPQTEFLGTPGEVFWLATAKGCNECLG